MSYVEVFAVDTSGEVLSFSDEARNNHVFAPLIWDTFLLKYGYVGAESGRGSFMRDNTALDRMWREWPSPKMTRLDNILLGATFDLIWIKRDLLPELIAACELFFEEVLCKPCPPSQFDKPGDPPGHYDDRAFKGVIKALKEIYADETNIGAAFNCCSANSPIWYVRDVDTAACETCETGFIAMLPCPDCHGDQVVKIEDEGDWDTRSYNVLKDTALPDGRAPWELSTKLERNA